MCQTNISVWFVCKLCRGSFGQVDAFIEHKKQKHFTQFQNTTSIVFEEAEHGGLCPTVVKAESQFLDKNREPLIKIELNDEIVPINPVSSEIFDETNLDLVEAKSELITYESEINPDNENSFFGLEQPEQNPYVLVKRLTSEEIESACVPQHHFKLLKYEHNNVANYSEPRNSLNVDRIFHDPNKVETSEEIQPTATVTNISKKGDHQFECKLCSKQLSLNAHLKIHVGICALYDEDRNRFCVTCNRKLCHPRKLKNHRLRFHGTEEEKLSLYKFKCHLCPKQYQQAPDLRFHLENHENKKQRVRISKSKLLKCSQPNCGKEFPFNSKLQSHIDSVHLGARPFSCHFPNCSKKFSLKGRIHLRIHTGERPFKCTVPNCTEAFITSRKRSIHHRRVHSHL